MKQYFSLEAKLITVLTSPDYQMIHARAMFHRKIDLYPNAHKDRKATCCTLLKLAAHLKTLRLFENS